MADTEFSALSATNTINATDSILVVRGGVPYRFTGSLPAIDASGNMTLTSTNAALALSPGTYGTAYNSRLVAASTAEGILQLGNNNVNSIVAGSTAAGGFMRFVVNNSSNAPTINGTEVARFDVNGNLLVGVTSGTQHILTKAVAQGVELAFIRSSSTGQVSIQVYAVSTEGYSTAGAALVVGKNSSTNRSINAGGTINASGADYAEYMRKAGACGILAKGQIVGVDADARLTDRFAEGHSFVIKSTDPAYVGGDVWFNDPAPAPPAEIVPKPSAGSRPRKADFDDAPAYVAARDAWQAARLTLPDEIAAWAVIRAGYDAAFSAYQAELADHTARLEAARATVDRVAFSGQVPCNVARGRIAAGDYVIGAEGPNGSIVGQVIAAADYTFEHSKRVVGKVWKILPDGRAWVNVLHN